MMIRGVMVV